MYLSECLRKEYIVLDGLKPGDEIVSDGAGMIREGIQVK